MNDKALDRLLLSMLYACPAPALGCDGALERDEIIRRSPEPEGEVLKSLERLRRDRLIELLGPASGPCSYRLARAGRACLDAVATFR